MLKIGITGGIGSGKSIIARIFEVLGIPVYYADEEARKLMNEYASIRNQLIEIFGSEVYNQQGLNRTWLAQQVFSNGTKIKQLNDVVHPAVIAHARQWMQHQQSPYVLKEAALFFESGSAEGIDFIVGVYAPQHLRIQRVMHRDGLSRNEIMSRMHKQLDEEIKMKLCDFVIVNDEQEMVIPQVLQLHQKFLQIVDSKNQG